MVSRRDRLGCRRSLADVRRVQQWTGRTRADETGALFFTRAPPDRRKRSPRRGVTCSTRPPPSRRRGSSVRVTCVDRDAAVSPQRGTDGSGADARRRNQRAGGGFHPGQVWDEIRDCGAAVRRRGRDGSMVEPAADPGTRSCRRIVGGADFGGDLPRASSSATAGGCDDVRRDAGIPVVYKKVSEDGVGSIRRGDPAFYVRIVDGAERRLPGPSSVRSPAGRGKARDERRGRVAPRPAFRAGRSKRDAEMVPHRRIRHARRGRQPDRRGSGEGMLRRRGETCRRSRWSRW